MNVVRAILGFVLLLPVLLVVGIMLGPAALVMLFIVVCGLPVVWVARQLTGHTH
jgi:hypothetical protein